MSTSVKCLSVFGLVVINPLSVFAFTSGVRQLKVTSANGSVPNRNVFILVFTRNTSTLYKYTVI